MRVVSAICLLAVCAVAAAGKATDVNTEPEVLRVNGEYVKFMCAQVAMGEAHVTGDKAKVAEVLKDAGSDQNELRVMMIKGDITPAQYAKGADAALTAARARLKKLLGDEADAKVEAAYEKPFTSAHVYLNQMRTAVAELGTGEEFKPADEVVYKSLSELSALARKPKQRTPEAITKIRDDAHADVVKALPEKRRDTFEKVLKGLTSKPAPTSVPAKHSK
jgi:hypothetical protein